MGFSNSTTPDENDATILNRVIWYSATEFEQPYPGDASVFGPTQLAGAADD
jgi:hypothetical protein